MTRFFSFIYISFIFILSQNAFGVPMAWGNIFTCGNPTAEKYLPFGIVFEGVEVFPFQKDQLMLSVRTHFNSNEPLTSRRERIHLSAVSIIKKDENNLVIQSEDKLYALSITCSVRCDYAGSNWEGSVTYATTWDNQLVQGIRTDSVICSRVGWL